MKESIEVGDGPYSLNLTTLHNFTMSYIPQINNTILSPISICKIVDMLE